VKFKTTGTPEHGGSSAERAGSVRRDAAQLLTRIQTCGHAREPKRRLGGRMVPAAR